MGLLRCGWWDDLSVRNVSQMHGGELDADIAVPQFEMDASIRIIFRRVKFSLKVQPLWSDFHNFIKPKVLPGIMTHRKRRDDCPGSIGSCPKFDAVTSGRFYR